MRLDEWIVRFRAILDAFETTLVAQQYDWDLRATSDEWEAKLFEFVDHIPPRLNSQNPIHASACIGWWSKNPLTLSSITYLSNSAPLNLTFN